MGYERVTLLIGYCYWVMNSVKPQAEHAGQHFQNGHLEPKKCNRLLAPSFVELEVVWLEVRCDGNLRNGQTDTAYCAEFAVCHLQF